MLSVFGIFNVSFLDFQYVNVKQTKCFCLITSNIQMKHSHKMPAMRGLPYTTNFGHSLMIKAKRKKTTTKTNMNPKECE